jgi:hypothetical protein
LTVVELAGLIEAAMRCLHGTSDREFSERESCEGDESSVGIV